MLQQLCRRCKYFYTQSDRTEQAAERAAGKRIVVDHEYDRFLSNGGPMRHAVIHRVSSLIDIVKLLYDQHR